MKTPEIVDPAAHASFRERASAIGLDPDHLWIGGYVAHEWAASRPVIAAILGDTRDQPVLEVGCNVGATAIVLSGLGAQVTAVDVNEDWVDLARANAARHGHIGIDFRVTVPGSPLPFAAGSFQAVLCNSVLEYVQPGHLADLLAEINRVLVPGGVLLVLGTSNRLWPREVHSRRWFANYVPVALDQVIGRRQRGIFPWQVRRALRGYDDLIRADGGRLYLAAKRRAGLSALRHHTLLVLSVAGRVFGLSLGDVAPSFALALRKSGQGSTP